MNLILKKSLVKEPLFFNLVKLGNCEKTFTFCAYTFEADFIMTYGLTFTKFPICHNSWCTTAPFYIVKLVIFKIYFFTRTECGSRLRIIPNRNYYRITIEQGWVNKLRKTVRKKRNAFTILKNNQNSWNNNFQN